MTAILGRRATNPTLRGCTDTSFDSDTSRPFAKPTTGRIAVKVINHLGDEVMKVFSVN